MTGAALITRRRTPLERVVNFKQLAVFANTADYLGRFAYVEYERSY